MDGHDTIRHGARSLKDSDLRPLYRFKHARFSANRANRHPTQFALVFCGYANQSVQRYCKDLPNVSLNDLKHLQLLMFVIGLIMVA